MCKLKKSFMKWLLLEQCLVFIICRNTILVCFQNQILFLYTYQYEFEEDESDYSNKNVSRISSETLLRNAT